MERAAFNLTGTSEMIGRAGGAPTEGLLFIPASVIGGSPILYGPTQSGGDSLIWFAGFSASTFEAAVEAAANAPAASGGVVFLPYLAGERAPIWDSAARGAFLGLLRQQAFEHGARAVMEGVAFSVRHVLEVSGITPGADVPLRITGGSTRVPLWNQIRADVTGLTVEIVEQSAVTLGAAMLTALGVGVFPSLSAAGAMVRVQERITPNPDNRQIYDEAYGRFRAAYLALRSLNG
jgi:xylulokinase